MLQLLKKKSTIVTVALVGLLAAGVSGFAKHPEQQRKRNLKVLPANISRDSLDAIMDQFKHDLGVKCNFCHAESTTNPGHLDFSSDDKPEKEVARKMMIMTNDINQKYMHFSEDSTDTKPAVTCITCHRGEAHPEVK